MNISMFDILEAPIMIGPSSSHTVSAQPHQQ